MKKLLYILLLAVPCFGVDLIEPGGIQGSPMAPGSRVSPVFIRYGTYISGEYGITGIEYEDTLSDEIALAIILDDIIFSKVSGPEWLTVASNGDLGGTPADDDLGLNQFVVRVANSFGDSDSRGLRITVIQGAPFAFFPDYNTNGFPNVDLTWMDSFNPPVTNFTYEGAPKISEWTRQGNAGDTIAITGEDF